VIELCGYVGAALLAFCAVPLLIKTIRDGHARGVSLGFLLMWAVGEALTLRYVAEVSPTVPLIANYIVNLSMVLVVLGYRVARGGEIVPAPRVGYNGLPVCECGASKPVIPPGSSIERGWCGYCGKDLVAK
jgi:uncharacterized protein with PQ loop repeat